MVKKMKTRLVALASLMTLCMGGMTVCAAPDNEEETEDVAYVVEMNEDDGVLTDDGMIEYTMSAEEVAQLNIIYEIDLPYMTLGSKTFKWTIPSGHSYVSGVFTPTGNTVAATARITPSNKTVKLGLVRPDGTMSYVRGSGSLAHNFTVQQSGFHKICVSNESGVTVVANGGYLY